LTDSLPETLTDPVAIARGQRLCREIASRENANFLHAARLLPGFRQDYFFATYAAMRVIDDRVDEDFLTLTTEQRDAGRDEARQAIIDWLNQSTVFGAAVGCSDAGPLHPDCVAALADTAGRSDLGAWPWHALAGALLSDVEEREMRNWADFLDYCAGATVAPAAIFIYLLAARHDPAVGYHYELPRAAREYAKDLAIYCYIVHILRDLGKDAGRSPRLITIPTEILAAAGLTRAGLSVALAERSPAIGVLAGLLISKARPFKAAGHAALREVGGHLGMVERLALNGLIAVYDRLFDRAGKDALAVALHGPAIEEVLRRDLLPPADEG